MSSVELSAVDTTASVPLAEPADAGAKVTVNVTLWFGESVVGKLSPLTEKPVPLIFASEIVTADPPVLVNVSERLELLLFCALPNDGSGNESGYSNQPRPDSNPVTFAITGREPGLRKRHSRQT